MNSSFSFSNRRLFIVLEVISRCCSSQVRDCSLLLEVDIPELKNDGIVLLLSTMKGIMLGDGKFSISSTDAIKY